MTDVWTSGGVVLGVGAVALSGWQILDSIVAILVAVNIIWTGVGIVRLSVSGLMDSSLPPKELAVIDQVLNKYSNKDLEIHALRTRQSASAKFISMHAMVPGDWTVAKGHQLVSQIESDIITALPNSAVIIHLEPLGTPLSHDDSIIGGYLSE